MILKLLIIFLGIYSTNQATVVAAQTSRNTCILGWFKTGKAIGTGADFKDFYKVVFECLSTAAVTSASTACLGVAHNSYSYNYVVAAAASSEFAPYTSLNAGTGLKINGAGDLTALQSTLLESEVKDRFRHTIIKFNGTHRKSWVLFGLSVSCESATTQQRVTAGLKFFGSGEDAADFVAGLTGDDNTWVLYRTDTKVVTSSAAKAFNGVTVSPKAIFECSEQPDQCT